MNISDINETFQKIKCGGTNYIVLQEYTFFYLCIPDNGGLPESPVVIAKSQVE